MKPSRSPRFQAAAWSFSTARTSGTSGRLCGRRTSQTPPMNTVAQMNSTAMTLASRDRFDGTGAADIGRLLADQVAVPVRHFHDHVGRAVRHALARQPRLQLQPRGVIELVQLVVGRFVAALGALADDDVTGGTGADAAAGV